VRDHIYTLVNTCEDYTRFKKEFLERVRLQNQKINADKRISDLEEKIAMAKQALAMKRAQLGFGQQAFALAA